MRKFKKIKKAFIISVLNYIKLVREIAFFIRQCLGTKKIVVISDKSIVSLPVSSKFQITVSALALVLMLWVSYSTGKYFAYESIISEKDREIWSTNNNNEKLQYQVTDLHRNLKELNKYFENIRQYDQVARKDVPDLGNEGDKVASVKSDSESAGAQEILFNIRSKVIERIKSLENIISMTGVKIKDFASNNPDLQQSIVHTSETGGQGGPYNPVDGGSILFDKNHFDSEVNYLLELEKVIHSLPLSMPLKSRYITSGFGVRVDPLRKRLSMHDGIDIVGPYGAEIFSTAPGMVVFAGRNGSYGKFVEIDHGKGLTTRYGHLSKILVKKGEQVARNHLIGLQGSTGRSTGPHLHYEVRYDKKPRDPQNFLRAGKYVF